MESSQTLKVSVQREAKIFTKDAARCFKVGFILV